MAKANDTPDRAAKPQGPTDDSLRPPPTFAGSALADAARRAAEYFGAKDARSGPQGAADPIELWGRRIGRGLSLAACIGLGIYLYMTYLR